MVTLSSKIVLAKMDFCGTGIAKKGNDRHTRFGWNYGLAGIMIIFVNQIDSDSIRIRSNRIEFFFYDSNPNSNPNSRFEFDPQIRNYQIESESESESNPNRFDSTESLAEH